MLEINVLFVLATIAVVRMHKIVDTELTTNQPVENGLKLSSNNLTEVTSSNSDQSLYPMNQSLIHHKEMAIPCICGVFLSGQFVPGSGLQPNGNPALTHEHDEPFPCNASGNKQCTNKCLDALVKHLSNSPTIICGTIDRDCFKERAYLWTKNCNDVWTNTNLSAGREYCCKEGVPYKCPLIA